MHTLPAEKLQHTFYKYGALQVAPRLLGRTLLCASQGRLMGGIINEVEAYTQQNDEASHSYNGLTERNAVMFLPGGSLYVYLIYGLHYCCNVVTGKAGTGEAVLIRSLIPTHGFRALQRNRYGSKVVTAAMAKNLANGPGKVCAALGITRQHNGASLQSSNLFICNTPPVPRAARGVTPRVGISKSADLLRRFFILPEYERRLTERGTI